MDRPGGRGGFRRRVLGHSVTSRCPGSGGCSTAPSHDHVVADGDGWKGEDGSEVTSTDPTKNRGGGAGRKATQGGNQPGQWSCTPRGGLRSPGPRRGPAGRRPARPGRPSRTAWSLTTGTRAPAQRGGHRRGGRRRMREGRRPDSWPCPLTSCPMTDPRGPSGSTTDGDPLRPAGRHGEDNPRPRATSAYPAAAAQRRGVPVSGVNRGP
jgi:hypothetical protein